MRQKKSLTLFIAISVCLGTAFFILREEPIVQMLSLEKFMVFRPLALGEKSTPLSLTAAVFKAPYYDKISSSAPFKIENEKSAIQIPVIFSPFGNRPMIQLSIGDLTCSLEIDLGSSHPIDLHPQIMKKIQKKEFLGTTKYIGIRKKSYETHAFRLPQVKLSTVHIDDLIGFEENLDFIRDAQIKQPKGWINRLKSRIGCWLIDGRMGWTFFQNQAVFLDFPHSSLTIAKNMDLLMENIDVSLSNFVKVPFDQKEWGMILLSKTDLGVQRFLLDTGASSSFLQTSLIVNPNKNSVYVSDRMEIANHDLGPWNFHLLEYIDLNHYDGILGIDFFKDRQVCIDFDAQVLYIK